MNKRIYLFLFVSLCMISNIRSEDQFDKIKADLNSSGCVMISFISIIESDIFDSEDSLVSSLCLDSNGRYLLNAGSDSYLYDLTNLYSYSADNAQVTVERSDPNSLFYQSISFIKKIDTTFLTEKISDNSYFLTKRAKQNKSIPDSLLLTLDLKHNMISELEFRDINGERNRIVILKQELQNTCSDSTFLPNYPDSVEWIRF